jgi:hypothetical protein
MKKKLAVISLLISQVSFAQIRNYPTQFDEFIIHSKIEWAAYASDTFNFSKAGLNNLLTERLVKKEIRASLPVESRTVDANQINYVSYDTVLENHFRDIYPPVPVLDSLGNVIEYKRQIPEIDTSTFMITEVTQILYIENGTLKSYIPWVTPTLPVHLSTGVYLGESFYYNTAYNFNYKYKSRKRNKIIFLKQTNKKLKLSPADTDNQLKGLYGRNLIETLWPYVLQNKIELFSVDNNNIVNPAELDNRFSFTQPIVIPLFDSVNRISAFKMENNALEPQKFTDAALVQDWYYDATKNIVFNKITAMYLYVNSSNKEDEKKPEPVFKLVFK